MLEKLNELGILDAEDGKLSNEEEIVLLHIYKSKLEGVDSDLKTIRAKIKSGELTSYEQELDEKTACFFDGDFSSGIEKIHAKLGLLRAEGKSEEKYTAAKVYEVLCERMGRFKNIISKQRENISIMSRWLSDEKSFREEYCASCGVPVEGEKAEMVRDILQKSFVSKQDEFANTKIRALGMAAEYILATEVRLGKYKVAPIMGA